MTYEELLEFLSPSGRMRMSAVYQPAVIRTLIDAGGTATVRQLAFALLGEDESQLIYYENVLRKMPIPVLLKYRIIERDKDVVRISVRNLTLEQRAAIRLACEQRLQAFIQKRGLSIWDHRLLEKDPVSDDLRYQTLKKANGRCELCGATKNDRPLDVDHIIPRARGGKNCASNLQVLCSKCNRTKRHLDDTDFRDNIPPEEVDGCPFCPRQVSDRIVETNGSVFAIRDRHPVTPGHILVIPRRHADDYFSMSHTERKDADELLRVLRLQTQDNDPTVAGFNVGMNIGNAAGQTIPHAHIHLIPRRIGDSENPRGGVRGVIPSMQSY